MGVFWSTFLSNPVSRKQGQREEKNFRASTFFVYLYSLFATFPCFFFSSAFRLMVVAVFRKQNSSAGAAQHDSCRSDNATDNNGGRPVSRAGAQVRSTQRNGETVVERQKRRAPESARKNTRNKMRTNARPNQMSPSRHHRRTEVQPSCCWPPVGTWSHHERNSSRVGFWRSSEERVQETDKFWCRRAGWALRPPRVPRRARPNNADASFIKRHQTKPIPARIP